MKIFRIICLIGWGCLSALSLQAQKKVPQGFQYTAEASEEGQLKELTQVSYSGTSSIRLYFEEVQMGPNSYLLLEGSDGAEQKMDAAALQNWSNSSAYFNGQSVKVSIYQAAGEEVKVKLKELKVSEANEDKQGTAQARKITSPSVPSSNAQVGEINLEETPWAKAVGRFTNGNNSLGTGWIAPNGAIVTSHFTYYGLIKEHLVDGIGKGGYDVIEFNVPNSNNDGSVNHPAPEDQYPINTTAIFTKSESPGYKKSDQYAWADVAILEPLKNSTGLLPGERQQQYFRILPNPSSFIVGGLEGTLFDIMHYGNKEDDFSTDQYKILKLSQVTLKEQKKYLSLLGNHDIDKDNIVLHDMEYFLGSESGAPIMFQGSNVAIGVHTSSSQTFPSSGLGFSHDGFRNALNNAFTSNVIYVDAAESLYDNLSGEIHKPYLLVGEGASNASDNAIVYIARGSYNESVTINKPLTLSAPVGVVTIGAAGGANSRMMRPNIPAALYGDDPSAAFAEEEDLLVEQSSLKSFPNPFVDHTELHYSLTDRSPVSVKVYNMLGQEIHTLVQEEQSEGVHKIQWDDRNQEGKNMPSGLYIMQLKTGAETSAVRIMKQ